MRSYKENTAFTKSVQENNIANIKRLLLDNIIFLQGDKADIEEAISYATANSDFKFEDHQALPVDAESHSKALFSEEKWNMEENYSKERFDALIALYNETYAKEEYTYETKTAKNNLVENKKLLIAGAVAAAAALTAYIVYKTLS